MFRWPWSGFTFIALLIIVFGATYVIARLVIGTQVQAAMQPSITWVTPTPDPVIDPTPKQEELLLPVMSRLLQHTPAMTLQVNTTPTMLPTTQNDITPATPTAQQIPPISIQAADDPMIPAQGGTCISGSIIDHFHQARGQGWEVTVTSGEVPQTIQADGQGRFQFSNLAAGVWTVSLAMPAGWQPFTPNSFAVTLSGSGSACAEVRFKVEPPACVDIIKVDKNVASQ